MRFQAETQANFFLLNRVPGWQFNWLKFGLSFGLKNGLRFHFDSVTCLNMSQAKTQSIFFATFCPIELERELQY